ncbi:16S rRNA (cytosine(1402)-N(4))-methyltransferase RsmH [Haploplasma axanthum]|uniref:Ribosomal RNA small subunit methyltransferase H n=1 Tax=Haploplasma axanthum TaxID=29552 RepID=A0A449BEK8_HAPAX|nr:16S rRNA (cytosine(1402)-N(4))-methyltransferase RsmH [Haploplasma axanthum]VEU80893.1 Ribosomal RNA small subunit methyltransferase H [Haploplasma axanthum]
MKHVTVLLNEAIEYLNIKKDGIYVDGTLGGAGHSELILKNLSAGHLYAFDQDLYAIDVASKKLESYSNKTIIHDNFANMKKRLNELGISKVDGILLDLGMSSFQIDDESRGFTYLKDAKLDMRMNQESSLTAEEMVNTYDKDELAKIFFKYGDEENSYKIVNEIIRRRPLKTTSDLVAICDKINFKRKGHSSKKVFQALRIAVNNEIGVLEQLLNDSVELLNDQGRIVIITFHSLEDRIVKHFFKEKSEINVPKNLPLINIPKMDLEIVTKKPVYPSDEELENNSRSKSAKMRVAKKIDA